MQSSVGSSIDLDMPNISDKIPHVTENSQSPFERFSCITHEDQVVRSKKIDLNRRFARCVTLSPIVRKKFFCKSGTVKNEDTRKSQGNIFFFNNLIDKIKKEKAIVKKFLQVFRRKKFYESFDNLSSIHYRIIGDKAAFPKDLEQRKKTIHRKTTLIFYFFFILMSYIPFEQMKAYAKIQLKKIGQKVQTFNPDNLLRILWDLVIICFISSTLIIYSLEKTFFVDLSLENFSPFLSAFLCFDLAVKMNTCFYVEGVQIKNRKIIFNYLLKHNFISDFLPFFIISILYFTNSEGKLPHLQLILLAKLIKINEIGSKIREVFLKSENWESLFDLIILVIKILIWVHLIACFWHYIGYTSTQSETWIKARGIQEEDWKVRYLYSVYWGFTTMLTVGYGDITPVNESEVLFNICSMVLGCGMFGYSMSSIGEIVKLSGKDFRLYRDKIKRVTKIMRDKGLPVETEIKVKKYLEFVWKEEQKEDPEYEKMIMNKLSSNLRNEIVFNTNVKYLKSVPIFQIFSEETLIALANYMKKIRFSPEEYIYREGQHEDLSLYFVIDGTLEAVAGQENFRSHKFSLKKFKKGDYFGIHEVFTGLSREFSVISSDFSTLFKLDHKDILLIVRENLDEYEKFCKFRDMDLLYNTREQYKIKCECCEYTDHPINLCKFLKFDAKKLQFLYKRMLKHRQKKKHTFNRKKKRSSNTIASKNYYNENQQEFIYYYEDDTDFAKIIKLCEDAAEKEELMKEKSTKSVWTCKEDEEPENQGQPKEDTEFFPISLAHMESMTNRSKQPSLFVSRSRHNLSMAKSNRDEKSDKNIPSFDQHSQAKVHDALKKDEKQVYETTMFGPLERIKSWKYYFAYNNIEVIIKKGHLKRRGYSLERDKSRLKLD